MKSKLFFLFLTIFLFTACQPTSTPSETSTQTPNTPTVSTPDDSSHPLSIDTLRSRDYQSRIISSTPATRPNNTILNYDSDGLSLNALVITPTGTSPANGWPVVFVNHGYIPPTQYSTPNSYINTSNYFASQGFLVIKPDYRGHDDSQGTPSGLFARSEYAIDVLNLISILDQIPDTNTDQIFLYGHSMGGEVSLITAIVNPNIRALTLWAPATKEFPENALYFTRQNNDSQRLQTLQSQLTTITQDQYPQFGSITNLQHLQAPLNLQFGTADESVPYQWGVDLDQALQDSNKQVNFYTYQGDTHDIPNNWGTALSRDVTFFRQYL